MRTLLLLLPMLFACKGTGSIRIDDSGTPAGDDSAADDSGDTAPPEDTGHPAEGSYTLVVTLTDAERGFEICTGEAAVDIDAAGALLGSGTCAIDEGPGAGTSVDLSFSGAVDAGGAVTGLATSSMDFFGEILTTDSELTGAATPPELSLAWEFSMGGGPNGGGPSFAGAASTSP